MILTSCKFTTPNDTIFVAIESLPKTLDPRFTTDANGQRISNLIFQSLVRVGPDLNIVGELAKSWTVEKNTYKFAIRTDSKFSNGKAVTKEDILFSMQEYSSKGNPFNGVFRDLERVYFEKENNDLFLIVKLKKPTASFLSDLSTIKIFPMEAVQKFGKYFHRHLIGSGPYHLERMGINEIKLVKNPYYSPAAKSDKITFKIIRDDNTRLLKILKGNIDIAPNVVNPDQIKKIKENDNNSIFFEDGLSMTYILLNMEDKDLKQLKFRQAIAKALDIQNIITHKKKSLATQATSVLSNSNPFHNHNLKPIEHDLEKAKKLVKELNLSTQNFTIKCTNNYNTINLAKIIAEQLRQIGLNVSVESYEWGTYYGDVKKGNFQIAIMKWVGIYDPDIYRMIFHSSQFPPGRNRGRFSDIKLDPLLEKGIEIIDPVQRKSFYDNIQEKVFSQLPTIPLWYEKQIFVVNKKVKNFSPTKNGDYSFLLKAYKK